ncbi:putative oxidoreductase, partial [Methylorubrum extorquens DSM 13060]
MSATGLPPDLLARLDDLLGSGGLLTDEADCAPFAIDWRRLFPGRPAAVARPSS